MSNNNNISVTLGNGAGNVVFNTREYDYNTDGDPNGNIFLKERYGVPVALVQAMIEAKDRYGDGGAWEVWHKREKNNVR